MSSSITRFTSFFLVIFVVFNIFSASVFAEEQPIKVYVDGQQINFDIAPIIEDDTTIVQFRPLFEKLGLKVTWTDETQSIVGKKDNLVINLSIGAKTATVNGNVVTLQKEPKMIDDRTFVPLRFVGEATGAKVNWDGDNNVININTDTKQDPTKTQQTENEKIQAIGKFTDRVVLVEIYDQNGQLKGSGSGFVISSDGKIATNYHVVKDASAIKVTFNDNKSYDCKLILNQSEENDLAILKIDTSGLPAVKFGDSSKVNLGETVVAIGSPLGLQNTLSTGVVSSVSRSIEGKNFIQTTAPIDHGSSGGALFNLSGELIGITSAGFTSQANLNLAIPSNVLAELMKQPPQNIAVIKKRLSLNLDTNGDITDHLYEKFGSYAIDGKTLNLRFAADVSNVKDKHLVSIIVAIEGDQSVADFSSGVLASHDRTELLRLIAADIHKLTNLDVYIGLAQDFELDSFPNENTGIASSEVERLPNGNWHIYHHYLIGFFKYSIGQVKFVFKPTTAQIITTEPLS